MSWQPPDWPYQAVTPRRCPVRPRYVLRLRMQHRLSRSGDGMLLHVRAASGTQTPSSRAVPQTGSFHKEGLQAKRFGSAEVSSCWARMRQCVRRGVESAVNGEVRPDTCRSLRAWLPLVDTDD